MTKEWEKPEDLRRRKPVLWLTMTALFMAMVVVLSMSALSIPVPGGHLYFNDVVIDTAAMLMDPLSAFIACGVGAFLGDLLFYPAPMFVSLITHGLQALVISLLCRKLRMKQPLACAIAVLAGAIVMVVGYTLGRAFVYSTPEYAIMKLPFQCLQAGVGAVIASVVIDMGSGVLKQKSVISAVIMLTAFAATYVFRINVVYVILSCIVIGVFRTVISQRRNAK